MIELIENGNWWVDPVNDNAWSKESFTRNQASNAAMTLENCTGCKNCIDCSNCQCCVNCNNCRGCDRCTHCIDCEECSNCTGCRGCDRCKACDDCIECMDSLDLNDGYGEVSKCSLELCGEED